MIGGSEQLQVGAKWQDQFKPGQRFAQQPALNYKGSLASPGYSYEYFGGACTYCIIPHEVMELGCLMNYDGDSFFEASSWGANELHYRWISCKLPHKQEKL